LEFSTFDRKIFRFFKFRAENFSARELSIQKNTGGKNFSASVPGAIGRAGRYAGVRAPSVGGDVMGVFPGFAVIGREFLGRKNLRAGKKGWLMGGIRVSCRAGFCKRGWRRAGKSW
jgi:hypothetical protein